MPFPNEHACRVRDPGDFQSTSFRRIDRSSNGKPFSIIVGRLKGETSTTAQSFRYPKGSWSAAEAQSHCKDHEGSFEAASGDGDDRGCPCDDIERRTDPRSEIRIATTSRKTPIIEGYAAVFKSLSHTMGLFRRFREIIMPGAFTETLADGHDIVALGYHEMDQPLGRLSAGTLRLKQDDKGLRVRIKPPSTTAGRDVVASIKRGDVRHMSFGFLVPDGGDRWVEGQGNEPDLRELHAIELHEVSPVALPSYEDTSVAVRSHELWSKSQPADVRTRMENLRKYLYGTKA